MGFDVGGISSGIKFDISQLMGGMDAVIAKIAAFPDALHSHIDAPLEHVGEHAGMSALFGEFALGEAAGEMLAKALESVGEAVKKCVEFIPEMINEVASASLEMGLLAEKSGVGVEFLSKWAAAGAHVNIGAQQIAAGFKFLEKNADAAMQGNKAAEKSFTDLGISMSFVKSHESDMEGMFQKIYEQLGKFPDQAERVHKAWQVFGRGGSELTPLLNLPTDKLEEYMHAFEKSGATVDTESARQGRGWKDMKLAVSEAIEGIEMQVSKPILGVMLAEWPKLEPIMAKATAAVLAHIPTQAQLAHALGKTVEELGIFGAATIDLVAPLAKMVLDSTEGFALLGQTINMCGEALVFMADKSTLGLTKLHEVGGTLAMMNSFFAGMGSAAHSMSDKVYPAFDHAASSIVSGSASLAGTLNAPITVNVNVTGSSEQIAQHAGKKTAHTLKKHYDTYDQKLAMAMQQRAMTAHSHSGGIR